MGAGVWLSQCLPADMPSFTANQIREIMDNTDNIRSMTVIAHNDHGKATLTDSFICQVDVISAKQAGDARSTDTRADEQELGVTIEGQRDEMTALVALDQPHRQPSVDVDSPRSRCGRPRP